MQNSNSALRFAGDVQLKQILLSSLNGQVANITNQVVLIEIYEDLFSSFTSLSIVVRESVDYINLFPFVGEEYIDIDIVTPTMEQHIKGRFYIYKIVDREYTSEREVAYTIKCISEEFITDANTKISKTFSGSISEIAFKIFGKDGLNTQKKLNVETTGNTTKITSNFWTPTKCLNYLASAATNAIGSPTYLFYENRDGFNFRSIDSLLSAQPYHTFIKDNYTRTPIGNSSESIKDPKEDYKRILEFSVPVLTDYITEIQSGRLKSRLVTHDIVTKKYTVRDYSVKKDPSPPTLLNPNPAYSKYGNANNASTMLFLPKYYANFTNFADVTNAKTTQKRMSFFQGLNKYKINIQVFGRTDYTIGQVVEVNVPKVTQITKNDSDTRDKILSGNYLVSAISHVINRENHTCNIELIKNSVLINLSNQ
jgi:hypothetical protein